MKRPAVSKLALSCRTFIGKTCSLIDNIIKIYKQCVDLRSVHIERKRTRKLSLMSVIYYCSPTKLWKVIFSWVCVILSDPGGVGYLWSHVPSEGGVGNQGAYSLPLGTTKAGGTYPTGMLLVLLSVLFVV